MRVLVTGHAGYIGSVIVRRLHEAGYDVLGLDAGFFAECGFPHRVFQVRALRKDVRDVEAGDLSGVGAVVHLAALSNDPLGDLDPALTFEINYRASVRLARLAREAGVGRFLFASSCSMYGAGGSDDLLDEDAPLRPLTPYAESKVRAEEEVSRLADRDFSPVFLRNATAYGMSPRLRADIVLNNLVGWACTSGRIRILSDGAAWRPMVHVEDISRAFIACLDAPREAVHGRAFNVGSDEENYRVRDMAEIVREAVPGTQIEYAGGRVADPRNYRVSFSRMRRLVPAFAPAWTLRAGARELHQGLCDESIDGDSFFGARFVRLAGIRRLRETGLIDSGLRRAGAPAAAAGDR
jgi:nucleoside-diphosphate-sugar epimerase